MTEKELKEKYFEMEKKFIDERAIKISEIAMNNKLREQIEVLRIKIKLLQRLMKNGLESMQKQKFY